MTTPQRIGAALNRAPWWLLLLLIGLVLFAGTLFDWAIAVAVCGCPPVYLNTDYACPDAFHTETP